MFLITFSIITDTQRNHINKMNRALAPDFQSVDEIRVTTIPRYKTSDLSGNEWRYHVQTKFYKKGNVVGEYSNGNVESAVGRMDHMLQNRSACEINYNERIKQGFYCDQEGCNEEATVHYKILNEDQCEKRSIKVNTDTFRAFCHRHSKRGDCGIDDADDNYECVTGNVSQVKESDKSPSVFGGVIGGVTYSRE